MKVRMNRFVATLSGLLLLTSLLQAQETKGNWWDSLWQRTERYVRGDDFSMPDTLRMTHSQLLGSVGLMGLKDTYLTPISHRGTVLGLMKTNDYPSKDGHHYHLLSEWDLGLGILKNPANQTKIHAISFDFLLGPVWNLYDKKGFSVDVGAMWDSYLNGAYKSSNSNNVFNGQLATGGDLLCRLRYSIPWDSFPIYVHLTGKVSMLHLGYAPRYGQPYYDYISGENRGKVDILALHPFNHQRIRSRLMFDLPIHNSIVSLGIEHKYLVNKAADNPTDSGSISFVLGISYDSFIISGRRIMRSESLSNSFYR